MQTSGSILDAQALAPQGACLLWRPDLLWLHGASDSLIALSSWSILAVLLILARRRRGMAFRWAFDLFALFILACGLSRFAGVWTLWWPDHEVAGAVKATAAALSVATAAVLWPLLPRLLALPAPAELAAANAALSREVVERREAEDRARRSEARFAGFFEHVADGLFVVRADAAGGCAFETVNPRFAALIGLSQRRIEGASPAEVLAAPEAVAELEAAVRACLASGLAKDWESGGAGAGDRARHWHTVLVPLPPDHPDGSRRLLGSLRDVTELRGLQAEAARRTMVGALSAGVAHEMSQPVNVIGLWAERGRATLGMSAGAAAAAPRRAFEVIREQTRRLGALLERMRELTREGPGEAAPFDAAAAVRDAVEVARRSWAMDGIEIRVEPGPEAAPPMVHGRAALLEQAVLHLLENAGDAVVERRRREPAAPSRIGVAVLADPEAGRLEIRLRDTGGGVPDALGDRILDPFVTTKDPGRGSGLGLPIAAGIARALGGKLAWCNRDQDGPAAGAEFRLCLPLHPAAAPAKDRAA